MTVSIYTLTEYTLCVNRAFEAKYKLSLSDMLTRTRIIAAHIEDAHKRDVPVPQCAINLWESGDADDSVAA